MAHNTHLHISRLAKDKETWQQQLLPLDADGHRIDVSSAILSHTVPVGAANQPTLYPNDSCYRFDTKFHGLKSTSHLVNMLCNLHSHPGCELLQRTPGKPSAFRLWSVTFACNKCYATRQSSIPLPMSTSAPGTLKSTATSMYKRPSLKFTKTSGSSYHAINGMENKKARKAAIQANTVLAASTIFPPPKRLRRCDTSRNESGKQCKMRFTVFLSRRDNYFYLSSVGNLEHTYHPRLPMKAIPQSVGHLDESSHQLLHTLYDSNVESSTVSTVMENIHGEEDTFFPRMAFYNFRTKYEALHGITQGITSDMSDVDKTQVKLNE